ncbi:MAG TPA: hypothetical protein VF973_01965, partial [Myxococcales bacterium]
RVHACCAGSGRWATSSPSRGATEAIGPHAGAGLGLDYKTRLDHFGVGLEAILRYSLAPRPDGGGKGGIASLALLPRIRYVF